MKKKIVERSLDNVFNDWWLNDNNFRQLHGTLNGVNAPSIIRSNRHLAFPVLYYAQRLRGIIVQQVASLYRAIEFEKCPSISKARWFRLWDLERGLEGYLFESNLKWRDIERICFRDRWVWDSCADWNDREIEVFSASILHHSRKNSNDSFCEIK